MQLFAGRVAERLFVAACLLGVIITLGVVSDVESWDCDDLLQSHL